MKNIAICAILLILSLESFAQQTNISGFGSIQGRVVDADGNPVRSATIIADPVDGTVTGIEHPASSDQQGQFFLDHVRAGNNVISASKTSDYYPETRFAVFAEDLANLPKVFVEAGKTTQGVIIHVGPKGGHLIGKILDSVTGQPVITSRIHLFGQDNPNFDLSTGLDKRGYFEFVLPSRTIGIEITAPGYKQWHYEQNGLSGNSRFLQLKPGSTQELTVLLQKITSAD